MNLIILTENDAVDNNQYLLSDHRAEHIVNVLKLSAGDTVEIGILNGSVGVARVEKIEGGKVILVTQKMQPPPETKPDITVVCALPRPQTMKKVLLISAMMSVKNIHFIRANRVEKSYYQSPLLKEGNYTPFLIEGLSQGKHTRPPEVAIHKRFKPFFEDVFPQITNNEAVKLLPDPSAHGSLDSIYKKDSYPVSIAIGPEGGWVPFEIDLMGEIGFKSFKLSRSILRVEYALTAVLSQIELIQIG